MVTRITHAWVKISEEGKLLISLECPDNTAEYSRVKLESPLVNTMGWSVEDFEHRAEELEQYMTETLYDRDKFEEALHCMIDNHDASLGINWDTVDYWLSYMCIKDVKEA